MDTQARNEAAAVLAAIEPSVVLDTGPGLGRGARRAADGFARLPLPMRVAAVVFPVVFVAALVWSPSKQEPNPIAPISIAPRAPKGDSAKSGKVATQVAEEKATTKEAPSPAEAPPADAAPPAGERLDTDVPAPDGWGYINSHGTKVLSKPAPTGVAVSRLAVGRLVKRYHDVDGYTLIHVPPAGSAGFVPTAELVETKPIEALAREVAYEKCDLKSQGTLDACLSWAESQLASCLEACGGERCDKACKLAMASCGDSCKKSKPPRKKRRRRRRRRR